MGSRVLVDTSLIVDLLRNVPQAAPELRRHKDVAISIVTWMEVLSGLRGKEWQIVQEFERNFPVVQLTPAIASEAVLVRRELRLKLPDAVILATAHVEQRVLLTRNTREFKPGRFVRVPYEL